MFIRLKKVQGKHYAYKVHNRRVRGKIKQKVKGYIGRACIPEKTNEKDFFEFIKKDIDSYNKPLKGAVEDMIKWELFRHNIDDIDLDINKYAITKDSSKVILKLNEGYLYNTTIKNIIRFHAVGDDEYFIGKEFAEAFVKAGIDVPKELFVKLFEEIMIKRKT